MRLICPNCGAQYEVDESVIPDGGRDVQCSNCGHAWYQQTASQLKAEAEAEEKARKEAAARSVPETVEVPAEPVEEPAPAEETPAGTPETVMPAPAPAASERPRRTLDDAVQTILREEADREARARRAEGTSLESQPELGITAPASAVSAPVSPDAAEPDPEPVIDDEAEDAALARSTRRELLPDIEEINSTLRATSERGGEPAAIDAPETVARRRSGFRRGFSTALIIAAFLLVVYILAPTIARSVPAAEPALNTYVAAIDAARVWLDGQMKSLTAALKESADGR